ncbi:hypothetical protein LHYA1_G000123 [Lachnellula hyalina]|uniref:Genetic interactor of prohibitins 3, mitochondrial n=1 Tax=Lachnellula hyalina TaxID=1316788 RepID=A0A8H8R9P4_9HELO|nr:uncharacterized protein LHYA1_G000123 [Lachnellula hyalina]TVY31171.1 hypothetical protein LHYA1_G000123 [Lachnellula hyalina]
MSACARSARLFQRLTRQSHIPSADLPAFLCPGILQIAQLQTPRCPPKQFHSQPPRLIESTIHDVPEPQFDLLLGQQYLPSQCAGCGALSQTILKDEAGFYTLTRRSVKDYTAAAAPQESKEDTIVKAALDNASGVGLELGDFTKPTRTLEIPICDRCHKLKHHDAGVSIQHPSIQSIQDTIFESPFKYNHVYHVLDAADFPMSLVPGLHKLLHMTPQRSLNRRSKTGRFYHGTKTEVSFIITRSDLLAPLKTQVDSMMPYLREVLRDALGRTAKDVRLVRISDGRASRYIVTAPPAPPEIDYPAMPLVSALPGTTASPIRLSFGSGKGELIDLPGLSRGDLEQHIQPEHHSSLVMRNRIRPEQQVLKPGKSLLLGGFIRITPTTPDIIMLGYAFTPIEPHTTSTDKAIGTQGQTRESSLLNISLPGTGEKIASAGTFPLKWDVTRERSGPLTAKNAGKMSPENLPFRVLATDILIEGCGWVELVAQVRKRQRLVPKQEMQVQWKSAFSENNEGKEEEEREMLDDEMANEREEVVDPGWPAVEVFTPNGRFVAARRPMNAWLYAQKPVSSRLKGRPRKSMKGQKKAEKNRLRQRV